MKNLAIFESGQEQNRIWLTKKGASYPSSLGLGHTLTLKWDQGYSGTFYSHVKCMRNEANKRKETDIWRAVPFAGNSRCAVLLEQVDVINCQN